MSINASTLHCTRNEMEVLAKKVAGGCFHLKEHTGNIYLPNSINEYGLFTVLIRFP